MHRHAECRPARVSAGFPAVMPITGSSAFSPPRLSFSLKLSLSTSMLHWSSALLLGEFYCKCQMTRRKERPRRLAQSLFAMFEYRKSVAPTHCPSALNVCSGDIFAYIPLQRSLCNRMGMRHEERESMKFFLLFFSPFVDDQAVHDTFAAHESDAIEGRSPLFEPNEGRSNRALSHGKATELINNFLGYLYPGPSYAPCIRIPLYLDVDKAL